MQNEWVVRQVDNMQDYKQSLLFNIAANLDAEVRLCCLLCCVVVCVVVCLRVVFVLCCGVMMCGHIGRSLSGENRGIMKCSCQF